MSFFQQSSCSAEQAADAIVDLINSRVRSPTKAELTAIIANVASAPVLPDPNAAARMDALRAAITAVESAGTDDPDVIDALDRPLSALTRKTWNRPAQTLADLQERALIARHWFAHGKCVDDNGKEWEGRWTNPADLDDWGERTVAELIQAVLGFAGELTAPIAGTRSALHEEIDRIASEYSDAYDVGGDPLVEPLGERLKDLASQLPQRASPGMLWPTVGDVAAWAEVAFTYAFEDKDDDGDAIYNADYPALNSALANLVTAARVLGSTPRPVRWEETPHGADWLRLIADEQKAILELAKLHAADPAHAVAAAAHNAAYDRAVAFAKLLWATPVRSPDDVIMRAAVVEWISDHVEDDADYGGPLYWLKPENIKAERASPVCDQVAIAHLLDGCRQLACLHRR